MICWIESVDPVANLRLINQIYSVLLNAFKSKEITKVLNFHLKMLLEDRKKRTSGWKTFKCSQLLLEDPDAGGFVVASTRHHRARLVKYYPRRACAPSLAKSRMLALLIKNLHPGW